MKKSITAIILILLLLIALTMGSCVTQEPTVHALIYSAGEGGKIDGIAEQEVGHEQDGATVTAIANEGYEFVKWSDGITTATRQDKFVQENITVTALFNKVVVPTPSFKLSYLSEEGGTIQGEIAQTVEYGQNGLPVTAIANEGFAFVKWSDDVTTATRQEKTVIANISVTAIFQKLPEPEPQSKTFALDYKYGECTTKPEQVIFIENEINDVTLPVPTREHFTFGGWYCDDAQVADTNGTLILNNELLDFEQSNLYAKWTANETFTYKILLVYVTRIDAILYSSVTESDIKIDYTMSDLEREFCHLTTIRIKEMLDDMLDGLVNFQVDEYYTQDTVTSDDFSRGSSVGNTSYSLNPSIIPEVSDIYRDYDSGLAIVNMEDYNHKLHFEGGSAYSKYGEVHLDSTLDAFSTYGYTLEQAVTMLKNNSDINLWGNAYLLQDYWLEPIIHELAHTIELRVNLYDYHHCVVAELYGRQNLNIIEADKLYFLNEAVMDGEKVGIPYTFWKGDIATVRYNVTRGEYGSQGYVVSISSHIGVSVPLGSGNSEFNVLYGDSITVVVKPFRENYRFVGWSDGVTTPERTDLITGDLTVTAIFEEIK